MSEKKRIPYLDVVRTIAIISITFNHAVNRSFAIDTGQFSEYLTMPPLLTVFKTICYCFSRIGVPLFVMISGALLIPRNDGRSAARFIKHNWLQLLITTEIWLAIMFWYKQLSPNSILFSEGIGVCIVRFFMTLFFINPITMGSMWYMEMILCVYLIIPILSEGLKRIDHRYFILPMILVTFCSFILPDINGVMNTLGIDKKIVTVLDSGNIFSMYVVVLLLGYFIAERNVLEKIKGKWLVFGCAVSFFAFCLLQYWIFTKEYDFVVGKGNHSIFPVLVAAFVFELFRRRKIGERIRKITEYLSRISFGIYFVHICIMEGLKIVLRRFDLGKMGNFFILELVSFVGAIIIIQLTKRVPWIKKNLYVIK